MKKLASILCAAALAFAAVLSALAGQPGSAPPGPSGGQTSFDGVYAALRTVDSDTESVNETFDSVGTDENAILLTGGEAYAANARIETDAWIEMVY